MKLNKVVVKRVYLYVYYCYLFCHYDLYFNLNKYLVPYFAKYIFPKGVTYLYLSTFVCLCVRWRVGFYS